MTPLVVWDVLGTLVEDPFAEVPGWLGMSLPELLQVKAPQAWFDFERGAIDEQAYAAGFFRDGRTWDSAGVFAKIRAFYRWRAGAETLLSDLRARGVEMHACSNYPRWYLWIEERLQLSRYMPWSFVSCNTGLRKPEPAAFEHVLAELGVEPGAVLFVDDQAANREAAEARGIRAFDPGDLEQLGAELARYLP